MIHDVRYVCGVAISGGEHDLDRATANGPMVARGALLLSGRSVVTMVLSAASAILLSRWLSVGAYGLFAQLNFVVLGAAMLVVGDLGLGLALLRSDVEPDEPTWGAVVGFSVVAGSLAVGATSAAAIVVSARGMDVSPWFIVGLGAALAARFSRVAPTARLLRAHRYGTVAFSELIESLVYATVALSLAAAHLGATALVAALVVKELVGAAILWARVPRPLRSRPSVHFGRLKPFLRVGLPNHLSGIFTSSTDAFQPVVIGFVLGRNSLGYVSWAYALILMPVFLLASMDRVIVPSLRGRSTASFRHAVETAVRFNASVAVPCAVIFLMLPRQLIEVVFDEKWVPTVTLVRLFAPSVLAVAIGAPLLHSFNALGRTYIALRLTIVWSVLTWTLGFVVVRAWGITGYGFFYVALQLTYVPIIVVARREFGIRTLYTTRGPAAGGILAAIVISVLPHTATSLQLAINLAVVVSCYLAGCNLADRQGLRSDCDLLRRAVTRPKPDPKHSLDNSP